MKRLSLEELKAQKSVVANLDAIKGGTLDACHGKFTSQPAPPQIPSNGPYSIQH